MRMLGSHFDIRDLSEFEKAFEALAEATDEDCERAYEAARTEPPGERGAQPAR